MRLAEKNTIDMALTYSLAVDMRPISMIEGDGFKTFVKFVNPGYTIPSRQYIADNLLA